jgi:hypothetical protein
MDTRSSANLNYTHTNENLTSATPLGIERCTSSTSGETHCPTCWSINATGINKYPLSSEYSVSITEEEWTTEKLIDELYLHLIRVNAYISNGRGGLIRVRKYQLQVKSLFWCIAAGKPTLEFIVEKSDLPDKFKKELEFENTALNGWRQDVLKQALGRIFEEVYSDYYHLSIAKNLRVRLV